MWESLTDYLSTWYISDQDIAVHQQVAEAQQAIAERQYLEGTLSLPEYLAINGEIASAGSYLQDYKAANDNPLKIIPWWVWVLAIGGAFFYLGGFTWLRGILAKKS